MRVLSSAMGCWVPYRSTFGMLRSSKYRSIRLPIAGPNVSLVRFSTDPSSTLWTSIDVVRDEKFMFSTTFFSGSRPPRYLLMVTVLAVPESPTNSTGLPAAEKVSRSQADRTVSTVGTRIVANLASSLTSSAVTMLFHVYHLERFRSKQYSYKESLGSCVSVRPSPS